MLYYISAVVQRANAGETLRLDVFLKNRYLFTYVFISIIYTPWLTQADSALRYGVVRDHLNRAFIREFPTGIDKDFNILL